MTNIPAPGDKDWPAYQRYLASVAQGERLVTVSTAPQEPGTVTLGNGQTRKAERNTLTRIVRYIRPNGWPVIANDRIAATFTPSA